MLPQRSSSPGEIIHTLRVQLPPRRSPKLLGYVSPVHVGRFAGLKGSFEKFGPCATWCVSRVCSAQRPPNFRVLNMPRSNAHSPSACAYFSLSSVEAGLAPKIQSREVPVNTDGLPLGNATSTGEPTPCIV